MSGCLVLSSPGMENFRLRVFRAVAHHLHFRKAAEELRLTQPAVTLQIRALEEELGEALFDRAGGRIALTRAGEVLLQYAERLHATAEEATEALAALRGEQCGRFMVGASQTIAQYVLPRMLAGFAREHPHVEIETRSGNTDAVLELLTGREVDLALIEAPALRRDVVLTPFLDDEMVLVAAARHPLVKREALCAAALRDYPVLLREHGSGSRRVIETALTAAGVRMKNMRLGISFDTTEGLLSAAEAGLGVTFVSRWSLRRKTRASGLVMLKVDDLRVTRTFSVAYRSGPEPVGNAAAFLRYAQAAETWLDRGAGAH